MLNVGFDTDVFREYREEIEQANLSMLQTLSMLGSIIGCGLFLISLIPNITPLTLTPGYAILAGVMLCTLIASQTFLKTNRKAVRYVWWFMLAAIYMAGILLGSVLQPNSSAVTLIVFIVAAPLFFIDRPAVIYAITGVMVILFFFFTNKYKSPNLANADTANACVFYLLGTFTCHQNVKTKMREIVGRRMLRRQRDTDGLTGLRNRRSSEDEISEYLHEVSEPALLLLLDVDNFKAINDRYGHDCGDRVLQAISSVLGRYFRANDILGRLGGDEFLVFLPYCTVSASIRAKLSSMLSDVRIIHAAENDGEGVGLSVGIAQYPKDGVTFQKLYINADEALYRAKQNGKGRYFVCGEEA